MISCNAVTPEQGHSLGQIRVIRHRHPAPARGDALHGVKAEHRDIAVSAVAHGLILVTGSQGMGGVFQNSEAVLSAQFVDGFHVAGLAAEVHGNNNLGQLAGLLRGLQFLLQGLGAEIVCSWINIHEIHVRPAIQSAVGRGHEGDRRCPERVPNPQAQSQAGQVQGAGSGIHGHGMAGVAVLGNCLFEFRDFRPLGQEVGTQDRADRGHVLLGDRLPGVGDVFEVRGPRSEV